MPILQDTHWKTVLYEQIQSFYFIAAKSLIPNDKPRSIQFYANRCVDVAAGLHSKGKSLYILIRTGSLSLYCYFISNQ